MCESEKFHEVVEKSVMEVKFDTEKNLFKVRCTFQSKYGKFPDNYWKEKEYCDYHRIGDTIDNLYMRMMMRQEIMIINSGENDYD